MPRFWIEPLVGERDLDGVLEVESESFTNPWTREMYASELKDRSVCHILVVRTDEHPVVGFCAFWLVSGEIHINNLAIRPGFRGQGFGTGLVSEVLAHAQVLGATRATLEVRRSNVGAVRLYERLGFRLSGSRRGYYSSPVEDALILWWDRDRPVAEPPV
jgi:[ribosomal protein S18]-alanine N-acetyltransferase